MTPNIAPLAPSKTAPARTPRRLSPELSELMHMLSSLDAKSIASGSAKE